MLPAERSRNTDPSIDMDVDVGLGFGGQQEGPVDQGRCMNERAWEARVCAGLCWCSGVVMVR